MQVPGYIYEAECTAPPSHRRSSCCHLGATDFQASPLFFHPTCMTSTHYCSYSSKCNVVSKRPRIYDPTKPESSQAVAEATMLDDVFSAGNFCEPLRANHRVFVTSNHFHPHSGSAKQLDEPHSALWVGAFTVLRPWRAPATMARTLHAKVFLEPYISWARRSLFIHNRQRHF